MSVAPSVSRAVARPRRPVALPEPPRYKDAIVAVVVPAYMEERHIDGVIESIPDFVAHIIVVDDGSRDSTAERVAARVDPRVHLVRHPDNRGVGAAIVTGHRLAISLGADISVVMAGDGQSDPEILPALLDAVTDHGYGYAKANRFFARMSYHGMPTLRLAGSMALTFLTKAASGYWNLVDPQNGYTAVRTDVLRQMDLDALATGYSFENDMLIWLNILDVRATDVDAPARYGEETSSMRLGRDGCRIAATLFRGFWRRIWRKYILWSFSPIALLLVGGLVLLGCGGAAGFYAIVFQVSPHHPLPAASVMLSVVPALAGFQLLLQALVLDIQATPK